MKWWGYFCTYSNDGLKDNFYINLLNGIYKKNNKNRWSGLKEYRSKYVRCVVDLFLSMHLYHGKR